MYIRRITFDDKTQTIWYTILRMHDDKPCARRVKEQIECPKEYFKRKLIGR